MSPPAARPLVIRCADGYALHGSLFAAHGRPRRRATVIICPAIFVREKFYHGFAAHLAERGFDAITFANRGMGISLAAETHRWRHRLRDWGERDLPAVIAHARGEQPDRRLYVVGHSMGGQLVALSKAVHDLDGIVTVAATAAWWGHWPLPSNLAIFAWYNVASLLARALQTFPAELAGLGPNVSSELVRDWARWGRHRHYIAGPFGLQPQMASYRGRLLVYSFTDDAHLGCRRAVESLHRHYRQADVTHRHVAPKQVDVARLGHFGYFRAKLGAQLWEQTISWMLDDRPGEASG